MSFVWEPPLFVPPPHEDAAAVQANNDNDHNPPPPQAQPDPQYGLPLPPPDPYLEENFRLTEQERQDALALKAAVEADDALVNLDDFQYVQFVLAKSHYVPNHNDNTDHDNNTTGRHLEALLEAVAGLQAFKEEYNIHDTMEDGMEVLRGFMRLQPLALLSVAYDEEFQNYGLIYDRSRCNFRKPKTPEDWHIFLGCPYYLFNSFCPDFHSMRQGIFLIGECQGMQNSRMSMDVCRKIYDHFTVNVPIKYRSIKFFHTNVVANISYSMMKPFLPRNIKERIAVGCQFGANISELYLLPNQDIAMERTLRRMEDFLRRRYHNQARYKLK